LRFINDHAAADIAGKANRGYEMNGLKKVTNVAVGYRKNILS
jgi:hypothetical protein